VEDQAAHGGPQPRAIGREVGGSPP
jgi:hypothetical protein